MELSSANYWKILLHMINSIIVNYIIMYSDVFGQ